MFLRSGDNVVEDRSAPHGGSGAFRQHARRDVVLLDAPVDCGGARPGCLMGPDALRTAGLVSGLRDLGHRIVACRKVAAPAAAERKHRNPAIHGLGEAAAWIEALSKATLDASSLGMPVILGGDHLMSAGTIPGLARRAEMLGRPLFVLWLDAHADFHDLDSTISGNLHGTPVAYFTGRPGFEGAFPPLPACVPECRVAMFGVRSVDDSEVGRIASSKATFVDMRELDEYGVSEPLNAFLDRVVAADGLLHVSLDVDFLDPGIAPGVGTAVAGGATLREAHLVMETLHDSGRVTSLEIAELNPFFDERGRTARLVVDLVASLFGRRVMGRSIRRA